MIKRCTNEKTDCYKRYGAKGIRVCQEWQESFESFRDWATENGYADNLTIDRKKGELGYSPDNCRWATLSQQAQNRKRKSVGPQSSRYHGVYFEKVKRLYRVMVNGKGRGRFKSEEDAARKYDEVARELYGEFAYLNFPYGSSGSGVAQAP
jgi:hypothetical protein